MTPTQPFTFASGHGLIASGCQRREEEHSCAFAFLFVLKSDIQEGNNQIQAFQIAAQIAK